MTVNMAIKKGVTNSKQTSLRAVTKQAALKGSGIAALKREKENEAVREEISGLTDQDATVVISAAMVLSDEAVLKAVHQNSQVYEPCKTQEGQGDYGYAS